jgi:hypothetical protein
VAAVLDTLLATTPVTPGAASCWRFLFRRRCRGPVSELWAAALELELALLGVAVGLLLLDRPQSPDIPAVRALEGFLRRSDVTLVVVSHDDGSEIGLNALGH